MAKLLTKDIAYQGLSKSADIIFKANSKNIWSKHFVQKNAALLTETSAKLSDIRSHYFSIAYK